MASIRVLLSCEADHVLELIREWMPPEIFQLTIYSCHGYTKYLQMLLTTPLKEHYFYAAQRERQFVGFSNWRNFGDEFFLNMICVSPEHRNTGIGQALFRHGVNTAKHLGSKLIALDVFDWNHRAQEWYSSLGFVSETQTLWLVGDLPRPSEASTSRARIIGFPQAETIHERFGFSMLTIETPRQTYSVGRLQDRIYRVSSLEALSDPDLLTGLALLDPQRQILCVTKDTSQTPDGFALLTTSIRMTVPLTEISSRLL